jgi:pantetheine-phosphate adenylyltransferase
MSDEQRCGVIGGTFDVFHDGHMALLNEAFKNGDYVVVGITSQEKAESGRDRMVTDFGVRKASVVDACKTLGNIHDTEFETTKIVDNHGGAIERDELDYIVLSPEQKTHERAMRINLERVQQGLDRLQIVECPKVTDFRGEKISATDIRNGLINRHGEIAKNE